MQEPVYVLHLITCHRRIMPRLAELLFIRIPHLICEYDLLRKHERRGIVTSSF